MEDLDEAIADTILALNTGTLKTRDNHIIKKASGKATLSNDKWREKLDIVGDMLSAFRTRLKIAKESGAYSTFGKGDVMYYFHDRELEEWFDSTRCEILKVLSDVCEDAGLSGLHFPKYKRYW